MTKPWAKALDPTARLYNAMHGERGTPLVAEHLRENIYRAAMPDDARQLRTINRARRKPTHVNCWYATYRVVRDPAFTAALRRRAKEARSRIQVRDLGADA